METKRYVTYSSSIGLFQLPLFSFLCQTSYVRTVSPFVNISTPVLLSLLTLYICWFSSKYNDLTFHPSAVIILYPDGDIPPRSDIFGVNSIIFLPSVRHPLLLGSLSKFTPLFHQFEPKIYSTRKPIYPVPES